MVGNWEELELLICSLCCVDIQKTVFLSHNDAVDFEILGLAWGSVNI